MTRMTIGEVARRSGLRSSALRYYEDIGLIASSGREGGRRVYRGEVVDRLALIELGKQAGFTLAEIGRMLLALRGRASAASRWRAMSGAKLEELDRRVAEAQRMKRVLELLCACPCPRLEDCGRACAANRCDVEPSTVVSSRRSRAGRVRAQCSAANAS